MKNALLLSIVIILTGWLFPGLLIAQNYAISLPGGSDGNNSNISIPALNLTQLPVTIEAWYKPESYNTYGGIVYYRGASDGGIQYDKWTNSKTLRGIHSSSGQVVASNEPVPNEWNHVAYVVTADAMTIYLNGVQTSVSTSCSPLTFDDGVYIGWDAVIADRTIKGLFDEVRIWNVARTAQEINDNKYRALTGSEDGLVGYWNFDDQAAVATDLTSNANHGTINGGSYAASFDMTDSDTDGIPDIFDNCPSETNADQNDMDADGIGDLCDNDMDGDGVLNVQDNCPATPNPDQTDIDEDGIGDLCDDDIPEGLNFAIAMPGENGADSNIDISGLNLTTLPFSVEMWIKPEADQNWNAGLLYNRPSNTGLEYASSWYSGGANHIRFMANGGDTYAVPTTVGVVTPGKWHHLAVVMTSTTRTVYLNGNPLTETSSFTPIDWSSGSLYLGWDSDGSDRAFKGLIDEVRIWNSARTEEEIISNMYKEAEGTEEGLLACYNFNDRSVNATDIAGGHNGTITGGTYTLSYSLNDSDEDGVIDMNDNCPYAANPDQADVDYDGTGDVCDDEIEGEGLYDIVTNDGYVTSSGANFVSFQQNAIMTYNGYQYITFWNKAKQVCLSRKKLPDGKWETIALSGYTSPYDLGDNHYNISFGICKNDGTIHVAFDHHNDPLHYRMSNVDLINDPDNANWSPESFGNTQNYLVEGQAVVDNDANFDGGITYPRFISKPNGDLLFECRTGWSGDGNSHLWEYTGAEGTWTHLGEYLHGRSEGMPGGYINNCGYINGLHYTPGGNRLHVSLVWRDSPDANTNHDICYAYSDDHGRTWHNTAGTLIGTTGSSDVSELLNLYSDGFQILSVAQNRGLINQEGQAVDSKGGIHILQSYLKDGETQSSWYNRRANAYMRHIYQDQDGVWQNDIIAESRIDRGDIAVDAADNLYVLGPDYRVYVAKADEDWATWYELDLSQDGKGVAEGLFDRELLLEQHVLSFVEAHSDLDGKIIVPHYTLSEYSISTDIEELDRGTKNEISCYPNPFASAFKINVSEEVGYRITDINGKVISSGNADNTKTIGQNLKSGIYFINVVSTNKTSTFKIIKQ